MHYSGSHVIAWIILVISTIMLIISFITDYWSSHYLAHNTGNLFAHFFDSNETINVTFMKKKTLLLRYKK